MTTVSAPAESRQATPARATIELDLAAILEAAAMTGAVGEAAVVERLGLPLSPVTLQLVATIVTRFPISISAATSLVKPS